MYNYGSIFRVLRENKNISISSLADEYISKGMISKFERNESDISVSRFFHLLEKIKIQPQEFFFTKNQYKAEGFSQLLTEIQQNVLAGNIDKLTETLRNEHHQYQSTGDKHFKLNCIMLEAIINEMMNNTAAINENKLNFMLDYLFRCENWTLYELILYGNSMSAFPVDSVIEFSKSIHQKILLMRESDKILEIGFNVILNTLELCIKHNRKESASYFLTSIKQLNLPQTMLFERALLKLYTGVYQKKFMADNSKGEQLIEEALTIFKLANCLELHDILKESVQDIFV